MPLGLDADRRGAAERPDPLNRRASGQLPQLVGISSMRVFIFGRRSQLPAEKIYE